jgi:hypothetical protein
MRKVVSLLEVVDFGVATCSSALAVGLLKLIDRERLKVQLISGQAPDKRLPIQTQLEIGSSATVSSVAPALVVWRER